MIRDSGYIEMSDMEFSRLSQLIKEQCGLSIKEEKRGILCSKLHRTLQSLNLKSFSEYIEFILRDSSGYAIDELINCVTINYTYFMRETAHFKLFKEVSLLDLIHRINDNDLRVWCSASSTGEEAYTLAILIHEFFGMEKVHWNTKILATDISTSALEVAKQGIYKKSSLSTLPKGWVEQYFSPLGVDSCVVREEIRKEVIFRRFNLTERRFPFKRKFHVIFCRNVMIYFDIAMQIKLQEQLYDCLEKGGYLFIGHAEALHDDVGRFEYIAPSVYRKL